MKRTYDSIQEVGWLADNGKTLRCDSIAEVSVAVTRRWEKDEEGREHPKDYLAHFFFTVARTGQHIGMFDRSFSSVDEVAEFLGIDEIDEVWEIIDQ